MVNFHILHPYNSTKVLRIFILRKFSLLFLALFPKCSRAGFFSRPLLPSNIVPVTWGRPLHTLQYYAADLGQTFPTSEYYAPDSGQTFPPSRNVQTKIRAYNSERKTAYKSDKDTKRFLNGKGFLHDNLSWVLWSV